MFLGPNGGQDGAQMRFKVDFYSDWKWYLKNDAILRRVKHSKADDKDFHVDFFGLKYGRAYAAGRLMFWRFLVYVFQRKIQNIIKNYQVIKNDFLSSVLWNETKTIVVTQNANIFIRLDAVVDEAAKIRQKMMNN